MKTFWYIVGGLFGGIFVLLIVSAIVANESAFTTNPSSVGAASGPQGAAPAFSGQLVEADTPIDLASAHQDKPVILDFWATWCPNCRRDMPKLSALAEKYSDDITVLGINLQEDTGSVKDFTAEFDIGFDSIIDAGDIARSYGVAYTNTHVLIGSDGEIKNIVTGDLSESQIIALIESEEV